MPHALEPAQVPLRRPATGRQWFAFNPQADTAVAVATLLGMWGLYWLNTAFGYQHPAVFFIGFVLVGHIGLNTVVPAWVVMRGRGEGLAGLGLTTRRAGVALLVSAGLAALMWPALDAQRAGFEGDIAPQLAFNAMALWEPLFVYGWLQLRFERAFGTVAGVVLAGASFALYHVGSFPADALVTLALAGVVYGTVFAVVRNLLVLVPLTWMVASTMGTLQGGFAFDWTTVALYAAVLLVQVAVLAAFRALP